VPSTKEDGARMEEAAQGMSSVDSADLTAATVTTLKYKILHIYEIIHFLIDPV